MPTQSKAPVEVDASELTYEEWFFLWNYFGDNPQSSMQHAMEWKRRSLGVPRAKQAALVEAGSYALLARGVLSYVLDEHGNVVKNAEGKPDVQMTGRIVSRMRHVQPTVTLKE